MVREIHCLERTSDETLIVWQIISMNWNIVLLEYCSPLRFIQLQIEFVSSEWFRCKFASIEIIPYFHIPFANIAIPVYVHVAEECVSAWTTTVVQWDILT